MICNSFYVIKMNISYYQCIQCMRLSLDVMIRLLSCDMKTTGSISGSWLRLESLHHISALPYISRSYSKCDKNHIAMLCKDNEIASASELHYVNVANKPSHGNLHFLFAQFHFSWENILSRSFHTNIMSYGGISSCQTTFQFVCTLEIYLR